jgi:hypothetical protein
LLKKNNIKISIYGLEKLLNLDIWTIKELSKSGKLELFRKNYVDVFSYDLETISKLKLTTLEKLFNSDWKSIVDFKL